MRWRSDGHIAHGLVEESDFVAEANIDGEPSTRTADAVCGASPSQQWVTPYSGQEVCLECWAIYRAAAGRKS